MKNIPDLKERRQELYLNRGYQYEDELNFVVPENFKVEYQPQNLNLETKYGSYQTSLTFKDHVLSYKRVLLVKSGKFPAEAYKEFAEFINKGYVADQAKVIFNVASLK